MTEENLLTCPWGPQNPVRKEKDTRVRKQANLKNSKHAENNTTEEFSEHSLLGADGEPYQPTAMFVLLCHRADRTVLEKHMPSGINLWKWR